MKEDFRKQHARTVREIAEKADPFTRKRLLDLASRYDGQGDERHHRRIDPPPAVPRPDQT